MKNFACFLGYVVLCFAGGHPRPDTPRRPLRSSSFVVVSFRGGAPFRHFLFPQGRLFVQLLQQLFVQLLLFIQLQLFVQVLGRLQLPAPWEPFFAPDIGGVRRRADPAQTRGGGRGGRGCGRGSAQRS